MSLKLLFLFLSLLHLNSTFAHKSKSSEDFSVNFKQPVLLNNIKSKLFYLKNIFYPQSSKVEKIIKVKMGSASISANEGDYPTAIKNAMDALEKATTIDNDFWTASIQLFLAKQYIHVGYLDRADQLLDEAKNIVSSMELTNATYNLKGELLIEKGKIFLKNENYNQALQTFNEAQFIFSNHSEDENEKMLHLSRSEYFLGTTYFYLNKYKESLRHLDLSHYYAELGDSEGLVNYTLIYHGYAGLYFKTDELYCSSIYFKKSLENIQNINCISTKKAVYEDAIGFFRRINNSDSIAHYSEKYIAVLTTSNLSQKKVLQAEMQREDSVDHESSKPILYVSIGAVFLIGLVVFYNVNNIHLVLNRKLTGKHPKVKSSSKKRDYLPASTEKQLICKLEDFEKKRKFLNSKMCLSLMATQMDTNAKYLRYLLKKNKNSDYTTYINELRISYIVDKLNTDPHYLQYKISYLADEAGFSSHSKFSKTFKKLTKYSPSDYIGMLESKQK